MNIVSDWSLESYGFEWNFNPEMRIRSSIFIITGVCAGLPALAWSVSDIFHHRKNGHRISIFIILLLLTDFIEISLTPYILIKLFLNDPTHYMDWTCWVFVSLSWAMKDCGLLLNQLVALEGILSVKYTASIFFSLYFRIFQIVIFLCVVICNFSLTFFIHGIHFLWVVLFMFIASVIPLMITCGTLCCANRRSHTSRKPDRHIWVILFFTTLELYLPYTSMFINYFHSLFLYYILYFLMSLRLISDPLLCVLVCRQNRSLQPSQKPKGLV